MEDFSKWFHSTYEIIQEPRTISVHELVYAYKAYCVPFYKNAEHTKNTTRKIFLQKMVEYEPEIYHKYFKKKGENRVSEFTHIRRRDGKSDWY